MFIFIFYGNEISESRRCTVQVSSNLCRMSYGVIMLISVGRNSDGATYPQGVRFRQKKLRIFDHPYGAMHTRSADYTVARLSVTRRYRVETVKRVIKPFSPSGSHIILVFPSNMLTATRFGRQCFEYCLNIQIYKDVVGWSQKLLFARQNGDISSNECRNPRYC